MLVFQLLKEQSQKGVIFRPKSTFFWMFFSWKVDSKVIIIAVMPKFGKKVFILVELWLIQGR